MKKLISALTAVVLAAALITAPVSAKTWVTVSSWAYNDVSNFKKDGLLPAAMEDVSDYTQGITRVQFAELLYSALLKTKAERVMDYTENLGVNSYSYSDYTDTDNIAANCLAWSQITSREETGHFLFVDSGGRYVEENNFRPNDPLTREEMAVMLHRTAELFCSYIFINDGNEIRWTLEPNDFDIVSDWAQHEVIDMLTAGMLSLSGGNFEPQRNPSIEEAITAVYRIYGKIPTVPPADGADITAETETDVQTYANGVVETKLGNTLYLKSADRSKTYMEFETDIYSNIYCTTVGGVIYAAAQNCYDRTDVYNAETGECVFKIQNPIAGLDEVNGYIITKSSSIGPMTFGLYSYNGSEVLPPEYSMEEMNTLISNGFIAVEEQKQEASGWIYYADWNDNSRLYRIDSNGENRQRLSENSVGKFEYIDGWIYFNSKTDRYYGNAPLYCIRADGKYERRLSEDNAGLLRSGYYDAEPADGSSDGVNTRYRNDAEDKYNYTVIDNWVYYEEWPHSEDGSGKPSLWRASVSEKGIEKENITEGYAENPIMYSVREGKIYFADASRRIEYTKALENRGNTTKVTYGLDLYCFDGEKVEKIDLEMPDAQDYCFAGDKLALQVGKDFDSHVWYTAELDGSNPQVWQEAEDAKEKFRTENMNEDGNYISERSGGSDTYEFEEYSDEKFSVYEYAEWSYDAEDNYIHRSTLYVKSADGKETAVFGPEQNGVVIGRFGDRLIYWLNSSTIHKESKVVYEYNMNTGEKRELTANMRERDYKRRSSGENWFTYADNSFNIWRYNVDTGASAEIFPNASGKKYGKVHKMLGLDDGMYKIDTDGNYSLVCREYAAYNLYVENGATIGEHF